MITRILYRGDSDKENDRKLKETIDQRMLFTNLISGGDGQIIFKKPLIELVKIHINPRWRKTHFLSFSEDKQSALNFGTHGFEGQPYPFYEDENSWDFALIKFDTSQLNNIKIVEQGVYICDYNSSFVEFHNGCKILLLNTIEYLKSNTHLDTTTQLKNAQKDKELLLLPINPKRFNNGKIEYSAKIDMSNIIDFEKYKMIE